MAQYGGWRFELAYFVAAEAWVLGVLPQEYGNELDVRRKANQLQDRTLTVLQAMLQTVSARPEDNSILQISMIIAAPITYFVYGKVTASNWHAWAFVLSRGPISNV